MDLGFATCAAVALVSTALAVSRKTAIHALLYLVVSFLAVAAVFWQLGAPLAAALELIVYAGAIVVLFVFVVMMLDIGTPAGEQERRALSPSAWLGPALLVAFLFAELIGELVSASVPPAPGPIVDAHAVAVALYGPYLVVSELASMLLLAGLVGAFHLGHRRAS